MTDFEKYQIYLKLFAGYSFNKCCYTIDFKTLSFEEFIKKYLSKEEDI